MDSLDRQLLSLLRLDGRMPVATIAKKIKVSRGTVQKRIDRLVETGSIQGFTVRTRPELDKTAIRAIMNVRTSGRKPAAIARDLNSLPEIQALYTTNGTWDYVAELRANNLADLDRALREIRGFEGIATTETNILLGLV